MAEERRAFLALVGGEVGGGDEAAVLSQEIGDLPGHLAVVEVGGIGGDAFQRAGEVGLDETLAGFVEVTVALEDAAGLGELRQILAVRKVRSSSSLGT